MLCLYNVLKGDKTKSGSHAQENDEEPLRAEHEEVKMHISQTDIDDERPQRSRKTSVPTPLDDEEATEEEIGFDIEKAIEQQFEDMPDVIEYEQKPKPEYRQPEYKVKFAPELDVEPEEQQSKARESTVPVHDSEIDAQPPEVEHEHTFKMPPVPKPVDESKLPDVSNADDMEFDLEDILNEFK